MYLFNGFVYGGEPKEPIRVAEAKALSDQMMLLTFQHGEQRLFDASVLDGPAFSSLKNADIFQAPKVEHGVVTWNDGQIDCAPEYMYEHSYTYETSLI